jgi:LSD1 subclass zinc finger protein
MMRKDDTQSDGETPSKCSHVVHGMPDRYHSTDHDADSFDETCAIKIRNTKKPPPSPPLSLLKSPPPTVVSPSLSSIPFASIEEDTFFVDTFDDEFIRQQKEILSVIKRQQQQYVPPDHHLHRQQQQCSQASHLEQAVAPSPTKSRGSKHHVVSHSGSHYSNNGGSRSCSHQTPTTATCSTQPSSNNSSSGVVFSTPLSAKLDSQHQLDSSRRESRSQTDCEMDLSIFLNDVDMIREQQRILDQIQRRQHRASCQPMEGTRTATTTSTIPTNASLQTYINHTIDQMDQRAVHFAEASMFTRSTTPLVGRETTSVTQSQLSHDQPMSSLEQERHQESYRSASSSLLAPTTISTGGSASSKQRQRHPGKDGDLQDKLGKAFGGRSEKSFEALTTARSLRHPVVDDHVFKIGKHKSLRLQGTRKAYDAISNGTAMIVQCATCRTILQVAASAKLLYCSLCENVTPVRLAKELPVLDPQYRHQHHHHHHNRDGGGDDDSHLDARLSRIIQQQEEDVAYARKLAKMSR